jgi:hypothetical protein
MAKNLRAKIPASDTLIVRDVNHDTAARFAAEAQEAAGSSAEGKVEIADNAREVAEKSVGSTPGNRERLLITILDSDDHQSARVSACH